MHSGLAGHRQVSPALANDLIHRSHADAHMAKAARGNEVAILDESGHRLGNSHAFITQLARFILPDPLPVLIGIMPADKFSHAFFQDVHAETHSFR